MAWLGGGRVEEFMNNLDTVISGLQRMPPGGELSEALKDEIFFKMSVLRADIAYFERIGKKNTR